MLRSRTVAYVPQHIRMDRRARWVEKMVHSSIAGYSSTIHRLLSTRAEQSLAQPRARKSYRAFNTHEHCVMTAKRVRQLDQFVDQLFIKNIVGKCKNPRSDVFKFFEDDVRLKRCEMNRNGLIFSSFTNKVIKYLEESTQWQWKRLNSGSYYDGTKVSQPDEMDCMLIAQLQDLSIITEHTQPQFCYVKRKRPISSLDHLCEREYLSAAYFRDHVFRSLECLVLQNRKLTRDTTTKEGCPAYCVNYDTGLQNDDGSPRILSIDLVPALQFSGWPDTARDFSTTTLPERIKNAAQDGFNVVAKLYDKDDVDDGHLFWKLSFTNTEKCMTKYADSFGANVDDSDDLFSVLDDGKSNGYPKTCRKKVLRILKRALDVIKTPEADIKELTFGSLSDVTKMLLYAAAYTRQHGLVVEEHKFSTFHLRTLMWNEFYHSSLDEHAWQNDNLMTRLGSCVIKLKHVLTGHSPLTDFFITGYDVMEDVPLLEREYLYVMASVVEKLL